MAQTLYHGDNEFYLNNPFRGDDLPTNWTTCPLDAISFAYGSAKRHSSEMAVLSFLDYPAGNFVHVESTGGNCGDIEWYHLVMPVRADARRRVKKYDQKDLAKFVEEHFDEKHDHLDSLKAMKYWDLIFPDRPVQEPGYYRIQEKPRKA